MKLLTDTQTLTEAIYLRVRGWIKNKLVNDVIDIDCGFSDTKMENLKEAWTLLTERFDNVASDESSRLVEETKEELLNLMSCLAVINPFYYNLDVQLVYLDEPNEDEVVKIYKVCLSVGNLGQGLDYQLRLHVNVDENGDHFFSFYLIGSENTELYKDGLLLDVETWVTSLGQVLTYDPSHAYRSSLFLETLATRFGIPEKCQEFLERYGPERLNYNVRRFSDYRGLERSQYLDFEFQILSPSGSVQEGITLSFNNLTQNGFEVYVQYENDDFCLYSEHVYQEETIGYQSSFTGGEMNPVTKVVDVEAAKGEFFETLTSLLEDE